MKIFNKESGYLYQKIYQIKIGSEIHYYRPQRSWDMEIFSEACVKNSVHRRKCVVGGCVWQGACVVGGCMVGGHVWQGCVCGRGCAWWEACIWGACMAGGGTCMAGGHAWQGACMAWHMHGRGHVWWGAWMAGGCVWQGMSAWQGACMAGGHVWQILQDMLNERAVHILLECILVVYRLEPGFGVTQIKTDLIVLFLKNKTLIL